MAKYEDLINREGTIFNKSTGQGYQDPTALASDLGIQAQNIDWNKITVDSLKPEKPIELPNRQADNIDYMSMIAGGQAMLGAIPKQTESPTQDWFAQYLKGSAAPPSSEETYGKLYGDLGIDQKSQEVINRESAVKSAQAEFDLINAQLKGISSEAQAQNLNLEKQISGGQNLTAGSADFLNRQQVEVNRQSAIKAFPLQASALAAQAKIAAAQGNVELAQQTLQLAQQRLDTVFQLKTADADRTYNYNKELRDRIYDYATQKEKQQLDSLQKSDDRKYQESRDNLSLAQQWASTAMENGLGNIASQITQLDTKAPDFLQKLGALQGQIKVNEDKKVVADLALKYVDAGISLSDDLATAQAKLKNSRIYQEQVRPPQYASGGGGETGGLTEYQLIAVRNQIEDNLRANPSVQAYGQLVNFGVPEVIERFNQGEATSVSDTILMRSLAKITDPTTGVREEEYRTFEDATGALNRVFVLPKQWVGKGRLTDEGRAQMIREIQDRFDSRQNDYLNQYNYYNNQASSSGISVPPPYQISQSKKVSQPTDNLSDDEAYAKYQASQSTQQASSEPIVESTTNKSFFSGLWEGYKGFNLDSWFKK